MSKKPTQEMIPGTDIPLTVFQEAALEYLDKKADAKEAAEKAKDAKDDLIRLAMKAKQEVIKVRNRKGDLIVFDFSNDVKVKETHMTDRKIEKVESEAAAAAGGGGPKK